MSQPTEDQRRAIEATGNTLVMAGAGAGKTKTLIDRCLRLLLHADPVTSVDRILMVTFTEAAASEMRSRLRERLEEEAEARLRAGGHDHEDLELQLALLEDAHISTLHGFCLRLIRSHFHELALDPGFTLMDEAENRQLEGQVLEDLLEEWIASPPESCPKKDWDILLRRYASDLPSRLASWVLHLHRRARSLKNPDGWLQLSLDRFQSDHPGHWQDQLRREIVNWARPWLSRAQACPPGHPLEHQAEALLKQVIEAPGPEVLAGLAGLVDLESWTKPKGNKGKYDFKTWKKLSEDAGLLMDWLKPDASLQQEWDQCAGPMGALIRLTREFASRIAETKRQRGVADFSDLEQFALRLLVDAEGRPTPLAQKWRDRFDHVFVDEYQDINEAQDRIIRAVSREGEASNRFLVGDVKQSIYRFRLADPVIFQNLCASWAQAGAEGSVLALRDNFRSHEVVVKAANDLFERIMQQEVGGVHFDENSRLAFGAPEGRPHHRSSPDQDPRIEFHLLQESNRISPKRPTTGDILWDELTPWERECNLIALRLKELRKDGFEVWDPELKALCPLEWKHVVILLRAPGSRVETLAREFARHGIPLEAPRGGLWSTPEIADLVALLRLLDNPFQDWPLLTVLRSPLFGANLDELARIRKQDPRSSLWEAMTRLENRARRQPETFTEQELDLASRISHFLQSFETWRIEARRHGVSRGLERILADTFYEEGLSRQPRGQGALQNLRLFMDLALKYDQGRGGGLFRFLELVDLRMEADKDEDVSGSAAGEAVRVMSIHRSKGLEFPVVVAADLGHAFNFAEDESGLLLDRVAGLCPRIFVGDLGARYSGAAYWMANRRNRADALGEEIRLLYVAFTRARDLLLLTATGKGDSKGEEALVVDAKTALDWILPWVMHRAGDAFQDTEPGTLQRLDWLAWRCWPPEVSPGALPPRASEGPQEEILSTETDTLQSPTGWEYPHQAATHLPAKGSISALRRHWIRDEDSPPLQAPRVTQKAKGLDALQRGSLHHLFLERMDLTLEPEPGQLQEQLESLVRQGWISEMEAPAMDLTAIATFWNSPLGQRIRQAQPRVLREWAFTLKVEPAALAQLLELSEDFPANHAGSEWMVLQGVADLLWWENDGWCLLDFKTDRLASPSHAPERAEHHRPQLEIYAQAIASILGQPVREAWLVFLQYPDAPVAIPMERSV